MINRLRAYISGNGLGSTLLKTVVASAGVRIAGMLFGFLVGVQLARGLGTEGYGIYGIAMSIIALLTVPTELGLPSLLTREVSAAKVKQDWARINGILTWSSRFSLIASILVGIPVLGWLKLSEQDLTSSFSLSLLAGLLMVPVVAQVSIRSAVLRSLQLVVRGLAPDVLLRPMFFSLLLVVVPWLVIPLSPPVAMALGATSATLALLVAQYMLYTALPKKTSLLQIKADIDRWWISAFPMALSEGMRVLQGQLSILIAGAMLSMSDVGIYRVAGSIAVLISMPITLFNIVGAPLIARTYAENNVPKLKRLMGLLALGMTVGVIALTIPFVFFGEAMIVRLFGGEFVPSNGIVLILGFGFIIGGAFGASIWLLNMTGYHKRVTRASLISLVFLSLSTPVGIYFLDAPGAAITSAMSFVLWNLTMWLDGIKFLGIDASIASLKK